MRRPDHIASNGQRLPIQISSSDVEYVHELVPRRKNGAVCLTRLDQLIREAMEDVWIATPWLAMTRRMRTLFRDCLARGVNIHILTNSLSANKDFLVFAAHLKSCKEMVGNGALIHWFPGPNSIHSKGIVIDRRVAAVGTQNLDPRSEFWNTECMVVLHGSKVAQELLSVIRLQAEGASQISAGNLFLIGTTNASCSVRLKQVFLPLLKLVSPLIRSFL